MKIVSVTPDPRRTAPRNSKMAATTMTCFKVRALAPTVVPKALATSLAPERRKKKGNRRRKMSEEIIDFGGFEGNE